MMAMVSVKDNTPRLSPEEGEGADEIRVFGLLQLPDPVVDILVSKCARTSLKTLLNLREVCSITKNWIDNYPELKVGGLVTNAQVRMGLDLKSVKRFNETSPPFPITSLSLDISKLEKLGTETDQGSKEEYELMWNRFFEYWIPYLESLEIQKMEVKEVMEDMFTANNDYDKIRSVVRNLLGSPKLKKVKFNRALDWALLDPFPKSFHNITDLIIDESDQFCLIGNDPDRGIGGFLNPNQDLDLITSMTRLYDNLEDNQHLRNVALKITGESSLRAIKKFIRAVRNNDKLKISLKISEMFNNFNIDTRLVDLIDLIRTTVAAECRIAYHLDFSCCNSVGTFFTVSKDQLTVAEYAKFKTDQIESFRIRKPPSDASVLDIQNLTALKTLKLTEIPERLQNFRFPSNLKTLCCGTGMPTIGFLPVTITALKLDHIRCGFDEFEQILDLISSHCVNLELFGIYYSCIETEVVPSLCGNRGEGDHATNKNKDRFRKLEWMTLKIYLNGGDEQEAIAEEILLNRLQLDQIPLKHLILSTHMINFPGVDLYPEKTPAEAFFSWYDQQSLNHIRTRGAGPELPQMNLFNTLAVVTEQIVTRILDGPLGVSLMFMEMTKLSFSPSGLTVNEKLSSKVKANMDARIERHGKGPWFYKYPKVDLASNPFYWFG